MHYPALLFSLLGLLLLIAGAEGLVRGASGLARRLGISPLVIGLTVVSFGTSSPEMAVSVLSALSGKADIAVGNVVGSNIFNVLFILGFSASITPLAVSLQVIRLDVPIMIAASVLAFFFGLNGSIGRLEGIIFTAAFGGYLALMIKRSRREKGKIQEAPSGIGTKGQERKWGSATWQVILIAFGLVLLVAGARLLVGGATEIARGLGVSELVIGLTVVAAGTSLPEVATSVTASIRGERDIAVGNVVGSNIFNVLAILGTAGIIATDGMTVSPALLGFDIPVMIASSVACLPIFFTGHLIARWEGLLFLGYYGAYTAFLILKSSEHAALPMFGVVMVGFVLPITVVTLLTITIRSIREKRHRLR